MRTYKPIKRNYFDSDNDIMKTAMFIARGQWADGHLAYSRLDENGNIIEDDDCVYIQLRFKNGGLYMQRI